MSAFEWLLGGVAKTAKPGGPRRVPSQRFISPEAMTDVDWDLVRLQSGSEPSRQRPSIFDQAPDFNSFPMPSTGIDRAVTGGLFTDGRRGGVGRREQ